MSAREPRPDALIVGAPKAGTSALHAALAQHPQMYASPVKEPKYYMCWDAPPPAYSGPGDAHSNQEWVWRREDYQALFRKLPRRPYGWRARRSICTHVALGSGSLRSLRWRS